MEGRTRKPWTGSMAFGFTRSTVAASILINVTVPSAQYSYNIIGLASILQMILVTFVGPVYCIHIYMYDIHTHMYRCTYMHTCTHTYIYIYTHVHVYLMSFLSTQPSSPGQAHFATAASGSAEDPAALEFEWICQGPAFWAPNTNPKQQGFFSGHPQEGPPINRSSQGSPKDTLYQP